MTATVELLRPNDVYAMLVICYYLLLFVAAMQTLAVVVYIVKTVIELRRDNRVLDLMRRTEDLAALSRAQMNLAADSAETTKRAAVAAAVQAKKTEVNVIGKIEEVHTAVTDLAGGQSQTNTTIPTLPPTPGDGESSTNAGV